MASRHQAGTPRIQIPRLDMGLDTSSPATSLDPGYSPDLANVLFDKGAASKRGGFVPLVRQHPKSSSVRAMGRRAKTSFGSPSTEYDALIAPAALYAGDRRSWSSLGDFTVEFFYQPAGLDIDEHIFHGTDAAEPGNPFGSPPFPVLVRPIISKGPVKKSITNQWTIGLDQFGPASVRQGLIHWNRGSSYGLSGPILGVTNVAYTGAGNVFRYTVDPGHGFTAPFRVYVFNLVTNLGNSDGSYVATVVSPTQFDITVPGATAVTQFGAAVAEPANKAAGMPFCVWLGRDTKNDPWRFRLSSHSFDTVGLNFGLTTVEANVDVDEDRLYHIVASVSYTAQQITLAVGTYHKEADSHGGGFLYVTETGTLFDFPVIYSATPIQVFDCPQEFIEAPGTISVTDPSITSNTYWNPSSFESRPPGLGLGNGSYFFNAKRAEGRIEDIAVWRKADGHDGVVISDFYRTSKLDIDVVGEDLIQYWDMARQGEHYVQEATGRGNHLYFAPSLPIPDRHSGSVKANEEVDGQRGPVSWWFNGVSSYATPEMWKNPNWRYKFDQDAEILYDEDGNPQEGVMQAAVKAATPHGLAVDFWVDAVAERFEQVIAEIHGALRLALRPDGKIAAYCSDNSANAAPATVLVPRYNNPVVSTFTVSPGSRYSVLVKVSANEIALYLDGQLNATLGVANGPGKGRHPLGGFTIGAGCNESTGYSDDVTTRGSPAAVWAIPTAATPHEQAINTDSRSHFMGRIERVKILLGDELEKQVLYREGTEEDGRKPETLLFEVPDNVVSRNTVAPVDQYDKPGLSALGKAKAVPGHRDANPTSLPAQVRYLNTQVGGLQIDGQFLRSPQGGAMQLPAVWSRDYFILAQWELDVEEDVNTLIGSHIVGLEYRMRPTPSPDIWAGVNAQRVYSCTDIFGALPFLQRRSKEMDLLSEEDANVTSGTANREKPYYQHRMRPYAGLPPRALSPSWESGLVRAQTGQTPITMLVDFEHQESGELFLIGAASRSVFWVKPVWREDTPFTDLDDYSLWMFGRRFEHARVESGVNQSVDGATRNVIAVEFWVRPQRLDGTRLVAIKTSTPQDPNVLITPKVNWGVSLENGRLAVFGTEDANTAAWKYVEYPDDSTAAGAAKSSIRANAWNHIYIIIGFTQKAVNIGKTGTVSAWVNGNPVAMDQDPVLAKDPFAGTPDGQADDIYIGGLPAPFTKVYLIGGEYPFQSFHGLITEFHVTNAEDSGRFPTWPLASAGQVPRLRYAVGANTQMLLHLNEGSGWSVDNDFDSGEGGILQLDEIVPIGSVEDESSGARYDASVFRDRVYLTNGRSRPREISFEGFARDEPFRLVNMGVHRFERTPNPVSQINKVFAPGPYPLENYIISPGTYQFWASFYDREFREGEPGLIATRFFEPEVLGIATVSDSGSLVPGTGYNYTQFNLTGTPVEAPAVNQRATVVISGVTGGGPDPNGGWNAIYTGANTFWIDLGALGSGYTLTNATFTLHFEGWLVNDSLGTSWDPQVVGRKIYVSPNGGGTPLEHSLVEDNISRSTEIYQAGEGLAIEVGRKLLPPRARRISAAQGTLFMANMPREIPAGGNGLFWSDSEVVTYFPALNQAVIDSENGRPIIGMISHLNRLLIFKRDSVWIMSLRAVSIPGAAADAYLQLVNQGIGLGGGAVAHNNAIIGAGDDGVYFFDGNAVTYASKALEGLWRDIPTADEDVLAMFGVFRVDRQQYWLSAREENQVIRVFDPTTKEQKIIELPTPLRGSRRIFVLDLNGDRQAWSRLVVPEHSFLARVQWGEDKLIVLGTTSGGILSYDPETFIDYAKDESFFGYRVVLDNPGYQSEVASPVYDKTVTTVPPNPSVTGLTVNRLTITGTNKFPNVSDGLRGAMLILNYLDTSLTVRSVVRTIEANGDNWIQWDEPLVNTPEVNPAALALASFVIGSYDGYWTTPWMNLGGYTYAQAKELFLEFESEDENKRLDNSDSPVILSLFTKSAIRQPSKSKVVKPLGDWSLADETEQDFQDLTNGFQEAPIALSKSARGRFFRVLFGTSGIRLPFSVNSLGVTMEPEGGPMGGSPQGVIR